MSKPNIINVHYSKIIFNNAHFNSQKYPSFDKLYGHAVLRGLWPKCSWITERVQIPTNPSLFLFKRAQLSNRGPSIHSSYPTYPSKVNFLILSFFFTQLSLLCHPLDPYYRLFSVEAWKYFFLSYLNISSLYLQMSQVFSL